MTDHKPLNEESRTWFIENEDVDHTGNLASYEHGKWFPEESKILYLRYDDVRSAYEGLISSLAGTRIWLDKREIEMLDYFEQEVSKWFPVFKEEQEEKKE